MEKYLDVNKYQKFFLKLQGSRLSENIKKVKGHKLSRAPEIVKEHFDTDAKDNSSITNKTSEDGSEENEDEELDLYSYKWENLTKAEQNQCLHESYQFLIKKYVYYYISI